MSKFLVVLLTCCTLGLSAQDSTKVRFYVKGSGAVFIKLDGELLPVSNIQKITPGEHAIEVWSPTYKLHKSTLTVPEKDSVGHYLELKQDPAYTEYLFAQDAYKQKLFIRRTAPIMLAGAGVVAFPFLHFIRKNVHETRVQEDFKAQYFRVSSESAKARYNTVNALYFGSIGAAVLGTGVYFLLRDNVKKLQRPVYLQKNPFTLENFRLSYNSINSAPELGFDLSF